jgi:hypothetical protein
VSVVGGLGEFALLFSYQKGKESVSPGKSGQEKIWHAPLGSVG